MAFAAFICLITVFISLVLVSISGCITSLVDRSWDDALFYWLSTWAIAAVGLAICGIYFA